MGPKDILKEVPGLALTAARYGMAERMARKVRDDKPIAFDLSAFIAADILDGVVLRKFDADTPARRVADGVVDRVSMGRVAYEAYKKNPDARPYMNIIAAREIAVGAAHGVHLALTGEVRRGRTKQRVTNLATAAFGMIALTGNKPATHIAGAVASGIALATSATHFRGIGKKSRES